MTHVEFTMNRIITTICLAAMFAGNIDANAQDLQSRIEKLAFSDAASQAAVSICAIKTDGQKIVDINSSMMLVPASNMKLISTGAAVHQLGPEFRFETTIGHDGEISERVLNGNVYIIGGGDPTLGSTDSIATPLEKVFAQWHAMLKNAGISYINGRIIGDGSCFGQTMEEPTWLMEDIGTYYGAGTTGLMFYENMQSFRVSAGAYVGDSVNITPSYPETPWMDLNRRLKYRGSFIFSRYAISWMVNSVSVSSLQDALTRLCKRYCCGVIPMTCLKRRIK